MSEKNFLQKFFPSVFKEAKYNIQIKPEQSSASFPEGVFFSRELFTHSYTGEKNLGEIGPVRNYLPDYITLRQRSWQAYTESEIAKILIDRHIIWLIGKGLKVQVEPVLELLKQEGIEIDTQVFSKAVEARFRVWRKTKKSDYANMRNLDTVAKRAARNAIIGGDLLVVLRYDGTVPNVQLIDGAHIKSPGFGTETIPEVTTDGNRIIHGVEINETGQHIRYHVHQKDGKIKPIEALSKSSGLQIAFMVYGTEYRLDNVRGIPLLSVVLETLKKLERYKEAVVGSAEERQKIVYQIVHQIFSDGTNPLLNNLATALDADAKEDLPKDSEGKDLANKVAATTNKAAFNMPRGAEMKGLESKNELYFADFFDKNIDIICAVFGIPPNVAMQKYNDSFSASRAALKDWEHSLHVNRDDFGSQFYQSIYNYFLDINILENKIQAPGYLIARHIKNEMVLEAYRTVRWVGPMVPHINPLVEVQAERLKLGTAAAHMPLTTVEASTESLNGGDSEENIKQFSLEIEGAGKIGIKPVEKTVTPAADLNP